jgi:hypothetical protein
MKNTQKALNSLAMEINRIAAMTEERHTHMLLNDLHVDIQQIKREQLPLDMEEARSQSDNDQLQESITDARTTIGSFFQDLRDIYEPKEGNLKP